jgi:predicted phage terminase large subunit-like protein
MAFFVSKEWAGYTGSVMAIDPSGKGGDETAYAVIKYLYGRLFLVASGGFKGGYEDDVLIKLAKIAKEHKVNKIVIESNFGQGMFTNLFKPWLMKFHRCGIEEVNHRTQKEVRIIDTLEPVMNQHKLIVNESIIRDDYKAERDYQLFYQMTRLTKDRGALAHDDRLDALAMAVAYWTDKMAADSQKALRDHRNDLLNKELEEFKEHVLGAENRSGNVLNKFG